MRSNKVTSSKKWNFLRHIYFTRFDFSLLYSDRILFAVLPTFDIFLENWNFKVVQIFSDGSNNVRSSMFDRWKPKSDVQIRLPIDEHIRVRLMFEKLMFESVR